MKYAVEARIFNIGKIVTKVRPAVPGEENRWYETRTCDVYIDIFDSEREAWEFRKKYKNA